MSSGWYERKLAALRGTPAATGTPQSYAGALPSHLVPFAPAQAVPQAPPPRLTSYDAQTGAQVADDGTIAALVAAAQAGGSRAVQQGSEPCPNCGQNTYFTIPEGAVFSKSTGGKVHAKQCSTCNFPQVQSGSTGGALQSARAEGPARAARQLPADHRVTVVAEGGQTVTFDPARR